MKFALFLRSTATGAGPGKPAPVRDGFYMRLTSGFAPFQVWLTSACDFKPKAPLAVRRIPVSEASGLNELFGHFWFV